MTSIQSNIEADKEALLRIKERMYACDDSQFNLIMSQGLLLPKLLIMTNNGGLRESSVLLQLIQYILRRNKESQTVMINCSGIFPLVSTEFVPFCCNFALVMLDVGLRRVPVDIKPQYAQLLIQAIERFPLFSSQSNNLMHLVFPLLDDLSSAIVSSSVSISMLTDWFLDLALINNEIAKGMAGSLPPGLSSSRIDRLLMKKDRFTTSDMKTLKLQILRLKSISWIPFPNYFLLSFAMTCDSDIDVAKEACFKLHAFISQFGDLHQDEKLSMVSYLLTISTSCVSNYGRSPIRDDVIIALLDFIQRNFVFSLGDVVSGLVCQLLKELIPLKSKRYQSTGLTLLETTLSRTTDKRTLESVASELSVIISSLIKSSLASSLPVDAYAKLIRRASYRLYAILSAHSTPDISVVVCLFRLMDLEDSECVVDVYACLDELRKRFVSQVVLGAVDGSEGVMVALDKCATSSNPKRKLIALSWSRALLGWSPFVLELLLLYADDANVEISHASASAVSAYVEAIKNDTASEVDHGAIYLRFLHDVSQRSLLLNDSGHVRLKAAMMVFQTLACHLKATLYEDFGLEAGVDFTAADLLSSVVRRSPCKYALQILPIVPQLPLVALSDIAGNGLQERFVEALYVLLLGGGDRSRQQTVLSCQVLLNSLSKSQGLNPTELRMLSLSIGLQCAQDEDTLASTVRMLRLRINSVEAHATQQLSAYACIIECILITSSSYLSSSHVGYINDFLGLMHIELEKIEGFSERDAVLCVSSLLELASRGLFTPSALQTADRVIDSNVSSNESWVDFIVCHSMTCINKGTSRLSAELIELISRVCCAGVSVEVFLKVFRYLLSTPVFFGTSIVYKFKVAEALLRMSLVHDQEVINVILNQIDEIPGFVHYPLLEHLFKFIEVNISLEDLGKVSSIKVLLLVLLRKGDYLGEIVASDKLLLRCSQWFLQSLRENHVFLQDICCLGLILTHSLAREGMANILADDVIATLVKEKRRLQPLGYGPAEQSTEIPNTMRTDTPNVQGTAAGATPGTTTINADALLGRLSQEFGTVFENTGPRNATEEGDSDKFGVYSTVSRIVKKTGLNAVLFTVLGLIQRDPDFAVSEARTFYNAYKLPTRPLSGDELKRLIPVLFVYRYESALAIKEIMTQLWQALVPKESSKRLVDSLENEIIKSLVSTLCSKSYRIREASCIALENFLFSRSWEVIFSHIASLWEAGIKVLDDIRDSTRKAAIGFMKVLSEVIVKACDPAEDDGLRMAASINFILPWLLDHGLLQASQEALGFSFGLLLRIIKTARSNLKAYMTQLVGALVESMSALEPRALQYLAFHTGSLSISTEEFESNRLKLANESPMQDSLNWCLKSLEPDAVPMVVNVLLDAARFGVGLATKVCAVQSLAYLTEVYPAFIGTEATNAYNALVSIMLNNPPKFPGLLSAILNAIRQYTKVVHPEYIDSAIGAIVSKYYTKSALDEDARCALASLLLQVINGAIDKDLGDATWRKVVLVSYVGSFDTATIVKEVWTKVFFEAIQGSGAGTKVAALELVHSEALVVAELTLRDLNWNRRVQGVALVLDLLEVVPTEQLAGGLDTTMNTLLLTLPGQIWTGQERVLEALAVIMGKLKTHLDTFAGRDELLFTRGGVLTVSGLFSNNDITSSRASVNEDMEETSSTSWRLSVRGVITLLLRESQRGNPQYRLAAAVSLSSLPWVYIKSASPTACNEIIGELMQLGGICVIENNISGVIPKHAAISKASAPVQRSLYEMYGSRYGIQLNKKPRPSRQQLSIPTESQSVGMDTESLSENASETGGEALEAMREDTVPSVAEQLVEVSPFAEEVRVVATSEPAFRVKMMETLAKCWIVEGASEMTTEICQWCFGVAGSEVWSIRRAVLSLLGALVSAEMSTEDVSQVLVFIGSALRDSKYVQIRKTSLVCLRSVVEKANKHFVVSSKLEIRKLILLGSGDTNPEVIETAASVQRRFAEILLL